ncbi:MAG: amidohydrolase family protein [Myxococcales bacterium]|nr:amidohydrolase family protein [Myxococcales bacterium]
MSDLLIRRAEVRDGIVSDVRIAAGVIAAMDVGLPEEEGVATIDAAGGALLPGLHDHHIHLFALAAAQASVSCGPPEVGTRDELKHALAAATMSRGWIRGVGYHETVAGELDRWELDALGPSDVPIRIQHRSGALWMLNSAAIRTLELAGGSLPESVERAASGAITGRIFYQDSWLRERIGHSSIPDLSQVGRELASYGVTAVMDATPDKGCVEYEALSNAVRSGEMLQRVVAMGRVDEALPPGAQIEMGPKKIMLREPALPVFDELVREICEAHRVERAVAFHCVTRSELVMAATALREAGARSGDRIEHASVAPPELVKLLAELDVWVVTQPGFIYERGDVYARDVDAADRDWLYRGRGFLEGGVALGAGTDAPYGDADPWLAIRAAVNRCTRAGIRLGASEALSPERAFGLFTSPIEAPGTPAAPLAVGDPADLCLVDLSWQRFREKLTRDRVALTLLRGEITWRRDPEPDRQPS